MKRCNTCGHTNGRLRQAKNYYTGHPLPNQFTCVSIRACIRRMELEGQWVGKRVLRRIDRDGTEWTIRRHNDPGLRGLAAGPWTSGYVLMCEYREQRTASQHPDIDTAKAHADEFLASFTARGIDAYRDEPQPESADQLELA